VTSKIADLEGRVRCSFQGTYDAKTKACKCNKGVEGTKCEVVVGETCAETTKSGPKTITPDGKNKIATFCEAKVDGGKWELMFNLKPNVSPSLSWSDPFWTTTKTQGSTAAALSKDFKGARFNTRTSNKELLIVAHSNNGAINRGFAS